MTNSEFDAVTALAHVREIRAHLEALDPHAGLLMPDEEHANVRRTVRRWEQTIESGINIRKQRSDAQTTLPLEKP